jgi:hypothetical protein
MIHAQIQEFGPFFIAQQKLFGIIGQDADAVDTLVDHAIEDTFLAFGINSAVVFEGRGGDGEDACIDLIHDRSLAFVGFSVILV